MYSKDITRLNTLKFTTFKIIIITSWANTLPMTLNNHYFDLCKSHISWYINFDVNEKGNLWKLGTNFTNPMFHVWEISKNDAFFFKHHNATQFWFQNRVPFTLFQRHWPEKHALINHKKWYYNILWFLIIFALLYAYYN